MTSIDDNINLIWNVRSNCHLVLGNDPHPISLVQIDRSRHNREPLYNHTKRVVRNAASSLWNASVRKLKELRAKKPITPKEGEELLDENSRT